MLKPGDVLQDRYLCQEQLGSGGQGSVFAATDRRLANKRWAIKELIQPMADIAERAQKQFEQEAQVLAHLNHPGLPAVVDSFTEQGNSYLVMELVEGDDLAARVHKNGGPLAPAQVVNIGRQLCDILEYLHSRQPMPVVHRDIKPANMKLEPTGRIKLVDFGLVKVAPPGAMSGTTIRGSGTPGFAPLEQYSRQGGTDARSDLYAAACCLYFLATATIPVDSPTRASDPQAQKSARAVNPLAPQALSQVIAKGMSMAPRDRFPSADAFRAALDQALKSEAPSKPCRSCGTVITAGSRNCPNCGAVVTETAPKVRVSQPTIAVAIGCILLAALLSWLPMLPIGYVTNPTVG